VGVLVVRIGACVFVGFDHAIANVGEIYASVFAIRSAVPTSATDVRVHSS
jgi:formate/nitrite transporter FocA (FNT family)